MIIRKFDVKKVEQPIDLGFGRFLPVGAIMLCTVGGKLPEFVVWYEGEWVKMSISANRLSGRLTQGRITEIEEVLGATEMAA